MKTKMLILWFFLPFGIFAQNGITFQVEELSKPETILQVQPGNDIYESLILSGESTMPLFIKKDPSYPYNIVAKSQLPDSLVYFGNHSFFNGMYQAYADHRPFVLSPDMVWLLITQGFARHINVNSEDLRHHFVDFSGKLSLIVNSTEITLENPNSPWDKVFPEFTKQIAEHTGNEFINILSSDFTTTTPVEKIATEITIMDAMAPYFEFIVIRIVCGIPEITLQGTPEDWQKVLDKTKQLSKYDLAWWTKELEPILEEFVKASKGNVDKAFWMNMFKYHTQKTYGAPRVIDGWIVKFFPYDKSGKRHDLKKLTDSKNLPDEIVKVDLMHIDEESKISTPLELWAGFVGLEQNKENFALTPKIGWMIRKKDPENTALKKKLESNSSSEISIRVKDFPKEILVLKKAERIIIAFLDKIIIPNEFANVKVKDLILSGKIEASEIERIGKMFPDSRVIINGKLINKGSEKGPFE